MNSIPRFSRFMLFLALFACKKQDTTLPELTLFSPGEGDHFNYGEVIPVHFIAKDETGVVQVNVSIKDMQNHIVLDTHGFSYNGVQTAEESFDIPVNDIQ